VPTQSALKWDDVPIEGLQRSQKRWNGQLTPVIRFRFLGLAVLHRDFHVSGL
jgi:hypothetical protein